MLERRTPVACIVPIGRDEEGAKVVDDMDEDAKPARLEHAGIVVRRSAKSPLDVIGPPLRAGAGILEALLDEREVERREGRR